MSSTRGGPTSGFALTLFLTAAACGAASFSPPSAKERLAAIGPTHALSPTLKRAFAPGPAFAPIPAPGPSDWLTVHKERPQGYAEYLRAKPPRPEGKRRIIYLQPLGDFTGDQVRLLETVRDYAAAFFALPVETLPSLDLAAGTITTRYHPTPQNRQLLSTDILSLLKKDRRSDAFCVLGITMDDLYPEPSWNFVFGQASLSEGVGVYSFARYDPAFYGAERGDDYETVLARRACQVLVHETGHMFGITHCVHFSCIMNGANSLKESDGQPLHLCPVCLRKLHRGAGFDVEDRYEALLAFYGKVSFDEEELWMKRRLARIRGLALPEPLASK